MSTKGTPGTPKGTRDAVNRFTTTVTVTDIETQEKGKPYTVKRLKFISPFRHNNYNYGSEISRGHRRG